MEWRDEGILLTVRRHGETSAIIEVLTRDHGRHAGVVRGGTSRKLTPILQPGSDLALTWRARLADHIGTFSVEPIRSRAGAIMDNRLALSGLNAITALLSDLLAEREPHTQIFEATSSLLDVLGIDGWQSAYLAWEMALLSALGFHLDLESCAATGSREDLAYVSPRSGRAVSRLGARGYEDRLLPLPEILKNMNSDDTSGLIPALSTTGHFLKAAMESQSHKGLTPQRQRLIDQLSR